MTQAQPITAIEPSLAVGTAKRWGDSDASTISTLFNFMLTKCRPQEQPVLGRRLE